MKIVLEVNNDNKNFNSEVDRKKLVDKIIELQKLYSKITKLNMKSKELFDKEIRAKKMLSVIRRELNYYKKLLDELDKSSLKSSSKDDIKNSRFKNNIIALDYDFKLKTYELFSALEIESNSQNRISILKKLKRVYTSILPEIDKNDFKTKKIVREILLYLDKNIKKEHSRLVVNFEQSKIEKPKVSINEQKDINHEICENIISGYSIDHYKLIDILENFRYLIRHEEINENIIKYAKDVCYRMTYENKINDENYLNYIHSILDSIKYRKYEVNDKEICDILKECGEVFKTFIEDINLRKQNIDYDKDYKFDIVCELLSSTKHYLTIKKLINSFPQIVNIRNKDKHIIIFILEEYISNYIKLLEKDENDIKNIDYLREVYNLFTKSGYIRLTNSEKKQINIIISDFITYVHEHVNSSKRKNHIVKEAKSLLPKYYYNDKTLELREVKGHSYDSQLSAIKYSNSNYRERNNEVDLTKEYTVMLSSDYTCYSLTDNGKNKSLKIHTCDISNLIPRYKALDNYIYNCMLENKEINNDILSALKFKINEKVSAFTYEIILDNSNNVIGFKIYRSKIRPNIKIDSEENNNRTYNKLRRLSNSIMINQNYESRKLNIESIEEVICHLLNDTYLDNIRGRDIPYIFSGTEVISSLEDITIYSNIKHLFNKLPKEEFIKIKNILDDDLLQFHYSDRPFNVNGEYSLNLVGVPHYLMLQNQRLIKTLYLNELNIPIESYLREKRMFKIEYNNLLVDLNDNIGFMNENDFDFHKRKVKKKIKIPDFPY